LDVDCGRCKTVIVHPKLWEYEVEEKLHLGVHEQKFFNITGLKFGLYDRGSIPGRDEGNFISCVAPGPVVITASLPALPHHVKR
jgi:hypothetical protein